MWMSSKEYVAESVVAALHRRVNGKRVLLVRAKVARDVIPRELRQAGAHVDVVEGVRRRVGGRGASPAGEWEAGTAGACESCARCDPAGAAPSWRTCGCRRS